MTKTIHCHCGKSFKVTSNGLYLCPSCGAMHELDIFKPARSKVHHLPGSCGVSLYKWLVEDMGLIDPGISKMLPVMRLNKSWTGLKGTMPWNMLPALELAGLEETGDYPELIWPTTVANPDKIMNTMTEADRLIVVFRFPTGEWHWIGIRKYRGKLHVADSLNGCDTTDLYPLNPGWPRFVTKVSRIRSIRFAR